MNNRYMPEKVKSFDKKNFVMMQGGQHHTMAQDQDGKKQYLLAYSGPSLQQHYLFPNILT